MTYNSGYKKTDQINQEYSSQVKFNSPKNKFQQIHKYFLIKYFINDGVNSCMEAVYQK